MTSSAPADEWNSVVLAQECGDLAVLAVLEDLLEECEQLLFERQVQRKLLPFTVDQVKRELLDSVYWTFAPNPPHCTVLDSFFSISDQEPECSPIDSWAPGVIQLMDLNGLQVQSVVAVSERGLEEALKNVKSKIVPFRSPVKQQVSQDAAVKTCKNVVVDSSNKEHLRKFAF